MPPLSKCGLPSLPPSLYVGNFYPFKPHLTEDLLGMLLSELFSLGVHTWNN